jgi:catechol 2,3-dioxygenase-like lactoylglutathione lyase family enzyme
LIEITDLSHVTLIVRDPEASRRFYEGVLGMEEAERPAGFDPSITWFRKGSAEIHLLHAPIAAQEPGDKPAHPEGRRDLGRARHLAFTVQDLDEVVRVLGERGVPVVLGPRPRGDGAIQLYCYDPDGHLVELHTPPTA